MSKLTFIKTDTQGIKMTNNKEVGYININVDNKYTMEVDAFEGMGTSYCRREDSLVNIYSDKAIVFRGTFGKLVTILEEHAERVRVEDLRREKEAQHLADLRSGEESC